MECTYWSMQLVHHYPCSPRPYCGTLLVMGRIGRPPKHSETSHYVRAWRKSLELSQEQVAEQLSVILDRPNYSRDQVSKLERGKTQLTEKIQIALAQIFGVEPSALWFDPDSYRRRERRLELCGKLTDEQLELAVRLIEQLQTNNDSVRRAS